MLILNVKKVVLLTMACFFTLLAFSQTDKSQEATKEKSHFKFDVNYLSNFVYLGRKDSIKLPYLSPSIGYYNKSGFYALASLGFTLTKGDKRLDYYSLDAGYEFSINKKLAGNINANKIFFNDNTNNVSQDIGGTINANLNYDFGVINFNAGTTLSFANKTDVGIDVSLYRYLYAGTDDKLWTFTPTALINFNTLNFYEGYTSKSFGKNQVRNNPLIASVTSTTTLTTGNKLTLMDIELSLPINYDEKNWGFYCLPTLAFPQNTITTSTISRVVLRNGNVNTIGPFNSTPNSEKNLVSTFYVELGAFIKF